jgi:HSP20 family protein
MSKAKKSLFERLTGIVKVDDNEEEIDTEIEDVNDNELMGVSNSSSDEEGQLAIDMYQTPTEIILKTMVAGVKPEDIDISVTRDMVTIRGKREDLIESSGDDYFHKELYWGTFSRTVILPQEVEVEDAEATNKNGLLTIKMPKLDKNRQTKLRVKSS